MNNTNTGKNSQKEIIYDYHKTDLEIPMTDYLLLLIAQCGGVPYHSISFLYNYFPKNTVRSSITRLVNRKLITRKKIEEMKYYVLTSTGAENIKKLSPMIYYSEKRRQQKGKLIGKKGVFETLTFFQSIGISIIPEQRSYMKDIINKKIDKPSFFSKSEILNSYEGNSMISIRASMCAGILISQTTIYIVYNILDQTKFYAETENKLYKFVINMNKRGYLGKPQKIKLLIIYPDYTTFANWNFSDDLLTNTFYFNLRKFLSNRASHSSDIYQIIGYEGNSAALFEKIISNPYYEKHCLEKIYQKTEELYASSTFYQNCYADRKLNNLPVYINLSNTTHTLDLAINQIVKHSYDKIPCIIVICFNFQKTLIEKVFERHRISNYKIVEIKEKIAR